MHPISELSLQAVDTLLLGKIYASLPLVDVICPIIDVRPWSPGWLECYDSVHRLTPLMFTCNPVIQFLMEMALYYRTLFICFLLCPRGSLALFRFWLNTVRAICVACRSSTCILQSVRTVGCVSNTVACLLKCLATSLVFTTTCSAMLAVQNTRHYSASTAATKRAVQIV